VQYAAGLCTSRPHWPCASRATWIYGRTSFTQDYSADLWRREGQLQSRSGTPVGAGDDIGVFATSPRAMRLSTMGVTVDGRNAANIRARVTGCVGDHSTAFFVSRRWATRSNGLQPRWTLVRPASKIGAATSPRVGRGSLEPQPRPVGAARRTPAAWMDGIGSRCSSRQPRTSCRTVQVRRCACRCEHAAVARVSGLTCAGRGTVVHPGSGLWAAQACRHLTPAAMYQR